MTDEPTQLSTDELADRLRRLTLEYDEALLPVQRGLVKIEHIRRQMLPIVSELARREEPEG